MKKKTLLILIFLVLILNFGIHDIYAGDYSYYLNVDFENSNIKGSTNISSLETVGSGTIENIGHNSNKSIFLNDEGLSYNLNLNYDLESFDFEFYVNFSTYSLSRFDSIVYFGGLDDFIKPEYYNDIYTLVGNNYSQLTNINVLDGNWHKLHIVYESGAYMYYLDDVFIGRKNSTNLITSIEFNNGIIGSPYVYQGYIDDISLNLTGERQVVTVPLIGYDQDVSSYESYFDPLVNALNSIDEWNNIFVINPPDDFGNASFQINLINKDVDSIYAENQHGSLFMIYNGMNGTTDINQTTNGIWLGRYKSQSFNINETEELQAIISAYTEFFKKYLETGEFDNSILSDYKQFEAMGAEQYANYYQIFSSNSILLNIKGNYKLYAGNYDLLFSIRDQTKEDGFFLPQYDETNRYYDDPNYLKIENYDQVEIIFDIDYMKNNVDTTDNLFTFQANFMFELVDEYKNPTEEYFDIPLMYYSLYSDSNGAEEGSITIFQDYNYLYSREDYKNFHEFSNQRSYKEIKIVINVRDLKSKYLHNLIDTDVPYEIKMKKNNEESNYQIYQFHDNYAVLLVPIVYQDETHISFSSKFTFNQNLIVTYLNNYSDKFYDNGNLIWETEITENNTIIYVTVGRLESDYKQSLFVRNKDRKNSSFSYDANKFTLVEMETSVSRPMINNPNTGETDQLDPGNYEDYNSLTSLFERVKKSIESSLYIINPITNEISKFFANLNPIVSQSVISLFIIILIGAVIKIARM